MHLAEGTGANPRKRRASQLVTAEATTRNLAAEYGGCSIVHAHCTARITLLGEFLHELLAVRL